MSCLLSYRSASHLKADREGMKKYSPPRSTLNVSIPWMRCRSRCRNSRVAIAFVLVEHDVRAVVRLGTVAQHRGLDVVEFNGDRCARKAGAGAIDEGHGVSVIVSWSSTGQPGHPAAQNEQWCAAAKSVVTFDCSGTNDSTLVPLPTEGQDRARVDGLPRAAKLAQAVRMLAASACWASLSVTGVFGRSNRYGSSAPCVARPRLNPRKLTGALSSLNW